MRPRSTSSTRLARFDFFGKKFKFNFSGNSPEYKTPIGGALTLVVTVILIPLIFVFGRKWVYTSKPTVSVNRVINDRNERHQLYEGNILSGLMLFNGADFVKFDETSKYATMKGERLTRYKDPQSDEVREYRSTFPFVHCGRISHNTTNELDRIFGAFGGKIFSPDVGICADWNVYYQWYIGGSPTQLPYTRMVFKIYPCSLENKADCADVDVLARSQFIFATLYKSMDFQNYTKPTKDGFDPDLTPLFSLSTQAKFTIWFKQNKIFDDKDSLSGNGPKFTFFNIDKIDSTTGTRDLSTHCTEISIEDGSCLPYITIEIRISKSETLIERRYYRIFDLVSDVGGATDIIFYAFAGLFAVYMSRGYQNWMVLQYYGSKISTEEVGLIHPPNKLFKQEESRQRTLNVETKKILKHQKTREMILKRLRKKMDVMTYFIFSQKAFIISHLLAKNSYYRALTPMVYFNLSKKLKSRKKEEKLKISSPNHNPTKESYKELGQAYEALVSSQPSSKFEQKLKMIFKEIIEKSGKIDTKKTLKSLKKRSSYKRFEFDEVDKNIENDNKIEEKGTFQRSFEPPEDLGTATKQGQKRFAERKSMIYPKSTFGRNSRAISIRLRRVGPRARKRSKDSHLNKK